jgi:hypothetical protein
MTVVTVVHAAVAHMDVPSRLEGVKSTVLPKLSPSSEIIAEPVAGEFPGSRGLVTTGASNVNPLARQPTVASTVSATVLLTPHPPELKRHTT